MRVLVTGASGLLGAATADALAARGDDVTVLQRRPSRCAGAVREVSGDVAEPEDVEAALDAAGAEAVVHLAARVSVVGDWDDFHRVNVVGTENLLMAARRAGVRAFVHVSTPSVAHAGRSLVGDVAAPASPESARGHYARSKAMAELAALDASSRDMPVVAVRPHLVWGPGDTQLVGRIVERARAGRLVLVGSGAALIDTTYLDNAVDALRAALDALVVQPADVAGRAFVVSNGEPRTVTEMLARICRAADLPAPRRAVPRRVAVAGGALVERVWSALGREDDPPMTSFLAEQLATAHWFDQRATQAALGWRPRIPLDEGFARLADWFSAQTVHTPVTKG